MAPRSFESLRNVLELRRRFHSHLLAATGREGVPARVVDDGSGPRPVDLVATCRVLPGLELLPVERHTILGGLRRHEDEGRIGDRTDHADPVAWVRNGAVARGLVERHRMDALPGIDEALLGRVLAWIARGMDEESLPGGLAPDTLTDLAVAVALAPAACPGADRGRKAMAATLRYHLARSDRTRDVLGLARGLLELFHREGDLALLEQVTDLVSTLARILGPKGRLPARRGRGEPADPVTQARFVWLAAQAGDEEAAFRAARPAFATMGMDGLIAGLVDTVDACEVHEALFKLAQVTTGSMQIPLWRGGPPAVSSRDGDARGDAPARVAILSREPLTQACPYLRLRAPLGALSARGDVDLHTPSHATRRYVVLDPDPVLDADVVVTQRFFPVGLFEAAVMPVLERADVARIHDLDDLVFDLPSDHPRAGEVADELPAIRRCLLDADVVTTTSGELARALRDEGVASVRVIPNAIDPGDWSSIDPTVRPPGGDGHSGPPVRIGWTGTATHAADLAAVAPALLAVLDRFGGRVELELRGMAAPPSLDGHPRVVVIPTYEPDYGTYARALASASIDIAIAPLADHRFNRAKSPIKWLEWSAAGVAGIYQDLPPYADVVEPGLTGLLASADPGAWTALLTELVTDPRRRHAMAVAAWNEVLAHHTVADTATAWGDAIADARARRRRRRDGRARSSGPVNPIRIPARDLLEAS